MVDYMSLEEQVDKDFERARRRAFLGWVRVRLRRDPRGGCMVPFDEVRHAEFDGRFMPTKASAFKWKRVDRAFRQGVDLPPVSLYRIGDSYFVLDGNHRVSVARFHGVEWMDALVTEFRPWLADAAAPREYGAGKGEPVRLTG